MPAFRHESCLFNGRLNAILFQVRGEADAYYTPGLEPWGEAVYNIQIAASTIELAISKARELMKEQFGVVGQPVLVKCELTHGV